MRRVLNYLGEDLGEGNFGAFGVEGAKLVSKPLLKRPAACDTYSAAAERGAEEATEDVEALAAVELLE